MASILTGDIPRDMIRVIIPFADDGQAERTHSLAWCADQWRYRYALAPSIALIEQPWRKGEAIRRGVEALDELCRVLIIADADVFLHPIDRRKLDAAIEWAWSGGGWAVPTARVARLNAERSAWLKEFSVLDLPAWSPGPDDLEEPIHRQHAGGGLVVIHRDAYAACPMDPRFEGWGHEDDAWSYALHTLIGTPLRGAGALYHLWHKPQDRPTRIHGSEHNRALYARYHDARQDPDAMRSIIDEWRNPS